MSNPKKLLHLLFAVLKGTLVGLAIVIPGVSGGSMLLTIGVYEEAISITSHDRAVRRAAIKTLIPYAVGIVIGVCALSFVITYLLEQFELLTILAFCGLILGSLPMLFKEVKGKRFSVIGLIAGLVMVALMIALPYLNDTSSENFMRLGAEDSLAVSNRVIVCEKDEGESITYRKDAGDRSVFKLTSLGSGLSKYKAKVEDGVLLEYDELEDTYVSLTPSVLKNAGDGTFTLDGKTVYLYRAEDTLSGGFGSAMLALLLGFIAAGTMIMPGISGSMVMLVLGYYNSVMWHLKSFIIAALTLNVPGALPHVTVLLPFGIGILLGLLLVSKGIKWLLDRHPVPTYYAIIGLMVTSPYAILVKASCFGPAFFRTLNPATVIAGLLLLAGGYWTASRMNR